MSWQVQAYNKRWCLLSLFGTIYHDLTDVSYYHYASSIRAFVKRDIWCALPSAYHTSICRGSIFAWTRLHVLTNERSESNMLVLFLLHIHIYRNPMMISYYYVAPKADYVLVNMICSHLHASIAGESMYTWRAFPSAHPLLICGLEKECYGRPWGGFCD